MLNRTKRPRVSEGAMDVVRQTGAVGPVEEVNDDRVLLGKSESARRREE